jgi:hypothetical protein
MAEMLHQTAITDGDPPGSYRARLGRHEHFVSLF